LKTGQPQRDDSPVCSKIRGPDTAHATGQARVRPLSIARGSNNPSSLNPLSTSGDHPSSIRTARLPT